MAASMAGFLSTAGVHLGNIITFPLSGVLCQYGFDGGWPSVFYVFGRCVRIGIMRMEFADLTYTKVTYLSVASQYSIQVNGCQIHCNYNNYCTSGMLICTSKIYFS